MKIFKIELYFFQFNFSILKIELYFFQAKRTFMKGDDYTNDSFKLCYDRLLDKLRG